MKFQGKRIGNIPVNFNEENRFKITSLLLERIELVFEGFNLTSIFIQEYIDILIIYMRLLPNQQNHDVLEMYISVVQHDSDVVYILLY